MKPNINIIGSKLREYEFGVQKGKERKYRTNYQGKSLEYRKYFNTSKASVEKSALDLWHYCEWIGKSPTDLISEYVDARTDFGKLQDWRRETKNSVLRFYREQKAKGYKVNMARNCVIGVMAFYSQNCEQVKGITRELDPVQIPDNEFVFNQETLRRLYYYGNVHEKTWLSCAVSLGYASVDFLALETEKIRNIVKEAKDKHLDFIMFIGKSRSKTSVQPRSFLTPEAIENLSEYLKMLEKQNNGKFPKYLWNNATNDSLNDWLKALMRKANIDNYGKDVRFHALRKFVYDTLSKMDETIACVITAKKTDASKITYRTSLDSECERIYRESYKQFALNGDVSGKVKHEQTEEIERLKKALIDVEKENASLKTRIEVLQKNFESHETILTDLTERLDYYEKHGKKKPIFDHFH
jgi:integrase